MAFVLKIRDDMSLRSLRALCDQGASVVKTPHVGNIYTNNLAVAQTGIPLLLLDRNIGRVDKNFHPHRVIATNSFQEVACGETLVSHAVVTRDQSLVPADFFPKGDRVAECHMRSLRQAVPNVNARVFTDYFHDNEQTVLPILRATAEVCIHRWQRRVTATGQTIKTVPSNWAQIEHDGIFGLNPKGPYGWVSPNVANIVSNAAIEALDSGSPDVYHLSGPDMYQYISDLMPDIIAVYDVVKEELGLPETLRFHLVPIANMRFAVPLSKRDALDELVDRYLELDSLNATAGERISTANGTRHQVINQIEASRKRINAKLANAIRACPEIFYDIRIACHVTQYDLILNGEPLYIHPWGLDATTAELKKAMDRLNRMRTHLSGR